MKLFRLIFIFLLTCYSTLPMQNAKESEINKALLKALGCGTVAGIAEVTLNQPLIYFKNRFQQGKAIHWQDMYKGYFLNVASMGPTTGLQVGIDQALEKWMSGHDAKTKTNEPFWQECVQHLQAYLQNC